MKIFKEEVPVVKDKPNTNKDRTIALDLLVLSAAVRRIANFHHSEIYRDLAGENRAEVTSSSICAALERLYSQQMLSSVLLKAQVPRRLYSVTGKGVRYLKAIRDQMLLLWKDVPFEGL